MAKEETIRKHAKDMLTADGWMVSMPKRQRFGATTTTLPDGEVFPRDDDKEPKQYAGHDDFFSVFDCIAWKEDKMRWLQWTSDTNVTARINKIELFLATEEVQIPKGCSAEVLGYTDRKGFTKHIIL